MLDTYEELFCYLEFSFEVQIIFRHFKYFEINRYPAS